MAKIYKGALELVGNTPLMEVVNVERELGLKARVLVKLEYLNPTGSVKDRAAKSMIEDAEERGILKEGAVIIEPTSGNTGIGLASIEMCIRDRLSCMERIFTFCTENLIINFRIQHCRYKVRSNSLQFMRSCLSSGQNRRICRFQCYHANLRLLQF